MSHDPQNRVTNRMVVVVAVILVAGATVLVSGLRADGASADRVERAGAAAGGVGGAGVTTSLGRASAESLGAAPQAPDADPADELSDDGPEDLPMPDPQPESGTDTAPPRVSTVSLSSTTVYATEHAACGPTSAVVSASVSDDSALQSVTAEIFEFDGVLPLSDSGGVWQVSLGPFSALGDGFDITMDVIVTAIDEHGNVGHGSTRLRIVSGSC